MPRSSGEAQTEVSALVAVVVVGLGLSLYAGVLATRLPGERPRDAGAVADRATDLATADGVVRPDRLRHALAAAPQGARANVSLRAGGRTWTAGPAPHGDAAVATRRVSVRVRPGTVSPGRLRVVTWR